MKSESTLKSLSIPIAIVIVGILIALAIYFGISKATENMNQPQTPGTQAVAVNIKDVKTDGNPFIGDPNAPITIAQWFDYQCPFCKKFDTDTMPSLIKDYVKTGKVKIVFKDFQFLGPDYDTAALIARAVWDVAPDKFYDWFQAMYDHQDGENSGWGNESDVLALTKTTLGAEDGNKVAELITTNKTKYEAAIAADRSEASNFGINGTPALIIGTQVLSGAQPYYAVKEALDKVSTE